MFCLSVCETGHLKMWLFLRNKCSKNIKCKWFHHVLMRVPGDRALAYVRFFLKFFLFGLVDSCVDFSQIQCLFSGVELRWKANCHRQLWHNHQDLGLSIWNLQVDPDRPLRAVRFFLFNMLGKYPRKFCSCCECWSPANRKGGFIWQMYDRKW